MERVVVSQLALAHETDQLAPNCTVKLYTHNNNQDTADTEGNKLR